MMYAQESGISLINTKTDNVDFIKENRRVVIKTADGKKYRGKFKIINTESIRIRKDTIAINSVEKIRIRPIIVNVLSKTLLIIGTTAIVAGAAAGGYGVLVIPVGVLIDGVGLILPLLPYDHLNKNWDYKIVMSK